MSKIEWTGETWNPLTGCSKVSAGCKNCYAIRMAWRLSHNPKVKDRYEGTVMKTEAGDLNWTGKIILLEDVLQQPLKNKKPTTYFVNSMSDLFHENVPFEFIKRVYSIMAQCHHHTFQVLTKRPKRMLEFSWHMFGNMPSNVWHGVSVEDQKTAEERIPVLLNVYSDIRFLSCEPLLGSLDLIAISNKLSEDIYGYQPLKYIHWIIAGGESGHGARPMHPEWVRSLRDQCNTLGISFFFKQWGEWYTTWANITDKSDHPYVFKYYTSYEQFTQKNWVRKGDACISIDGTICKQGSDFMKCAYPVAIMQKVGKHSSGRLLDGKEWNQLPNQNQL